MRITVLGSGTSHGVPVIGCKCPVCTDTDPRDKRYRSSIMVEEGGSRIVIDTGYEFRLQMLRENVSGLDAVLYTHSHADHVSGIDDLRVFSRERNLPIYGNAETMQFIKEHYAYAFDKDSFPGNPHLVPNVLAPLGISHRLHFHSPCRFRGIERGQDDNDRCPEKDCPWRPLLI